MPIFTYKARDLKGQDQVGEIESVEAHSAVGMLRKRGLVVISVKPKSLGTLTILDKVFHKISIDDVVNFTRQLATMIEAGLVLSEAVDILAEQQTSRRFRSVLEEISGDLKGGLSFAACLSRHADTFPPLYINLVKAGEISGKLSEVFLKMADSLEKDREFRGRIKGAMVYPTVVVSVMILVIIIVMVFVIPKLTGFYSQSSLELPLPTKILIGASNFVINFWWVLLALVVVTFITVRHYLNTQSGKLVFDKLILRIPRVGRLISFIILTNFNRTFSLLTSAGIPLLEAISIVEGVSGNSVYKEGLKSAYIGVEKGLTLSQQLLVLPYFPKLVGQMVRVGEETGKVDEMFVRLADYFEGESDRGIKNLTVVIEPTVLVILGIGVAFLVISIILPIYTLTTSF